MTDSRSVDSRPSVQILSDKSDVPSGQKYPGTHGRHSTCVKFDLNDPASQIEHARSLSNRNPSKATGPNPRSHAIGRGEPSGQKNGKSHLKWFSKSKHWSVESVRSSSDKDSL